jgi:hypothetical protein
MPDIRRGARRAQELPAVLGYAQVTVSAACRLFKGLRDHTDMYGRGV